MKEIILAALAAIGLLSMFKRKEDKWIWVGFGEDPFAKEKQN
jgi:hypothetical protein